MYYQNARDKNDLQTTTHRSHLILPRLLHLDLLEQLQSDLVRLLILHEFSSARKCQLMRSPNQSEYLFH